MSDKSEKEHKQELQEMINKREPNQPIEQVLSIFCERHGIAMETCRVYYKQLVNEGKVKEK